MIEYELEGMDLGEVRFAISPLNELTLSLRTMRDPGRYPLAGEWINVNTPPDSVVLANQHSGSLRWYGKRQTLRWDFIDPQQLATTVREIQAHGATVYVALEGDEVKMFDQRFAGVIDQVQVDHIGQIRNVSFRRLLAAK